MNLINNNTFFDALLKYTDDGDLSQAEKNDLKQRYISQTGVSEQEYLDFIEPSLNNLFSDASLEEAKTISELIEAAIEDGSLTYFEYVNLRDTYIKKYGIDAYKFNEVFSLLTGDQKHVLEWIYNKEKHNSEDLEIEEIISRKFSGNIANFLEKELHKHFMNSMIKGRCYDDFSEYVFEMLKSEIDRTNHKDTPTLSKYF